MILIIFKKLAELIARQKDDFVKTAETAIYKPWNNAK